LTAEFPGTALLGELSSQPGAFARCQQFSGQGLLHMAYTLKLMKGALTAGHFAAALGEAADAEATARGWICWSFSNHDVARTASRWNPDRNPALDRLLAVLLLSLRGSVCIYQGEELGLPEAEIAFEDIADPFGKAFWPAFRGRDGSRTPIPWHADAVHGGFMAEGEAARDDDPADPWLPLPDDHRGHAVDRQVGDAGSLLHHWRAMIAWRRAHSALVDGRLTIVDTPEPLLAFHRGEGEDQVTCLFNLSADGQRVRLDAFGGEGVALDAPGACGDLRDGTLFLPPYGYSLLRTPVTAEKPPLEAIA
jgi:alpha-glucosidase